MSSLFLQLPWNTTVNPWNPNAALICSMASISSLQRFNRFVWRTASTCWFGLDNFETFFLINFGIMCATLHKFFVSSNNDETFRLNFRVAQSDFGTMVLTGIKNFNCLFHWPDSQCWSISSPLDGSSKLEILSSCYSFSVLVSTAWFASKMYIFSTPRRINVGFFWNLNVVK